MSEAREQILERVRAALADVPADEPADLGSRDCHRVESGLSAAQRADLFAERVAEYQATIRRAGAGGGETADAVAEAVAAHGASRVIVPPGLPAVLRPRGIEVVEDSPDLSARDLEAFDGVLTRCALAIAETGTMILDSGPDQGRRALTLVPDLHVCVVDAERIVGSVPEAIRTLERRARDQRPPLTLISGPSATSDIELNRVEGVHGPRRLEVVIAG